MEIPTSKGKNLVTGHESLRPDAKKPVILNPREPTDKRSLSPERNHGLSIKAETLNKFADNEPLSTARDKELQPLVATDTQESVDLSFDMGSFEADCANHEKLVEFTKAQFKEVHTMFKVAKNRILKAEQKTQSASNRLSNIETLNVRVEKFNQEIEEKVIANSRGI